MEEANRYSDEGILASNGGGALKVRVRRGWHLTNNNIIFATATVSNPFFFLKLGAIKSFWILQ